MDHFSDLEFVCSGRSRSTSARFSRPFFEYYGLQFIRSGGEDR